MDADTRHALDTVIPLRLALNAHSFDLARLLSLSRLYGIQVVCADEMKFSQLMFRKEPE